MPRVENLGKNVDAYCQRTGNGSSTFDICTECADELADDPHIFDTILIPYHTDEPFGLDGRGGNVEHLRYEDDDETVECEVCNCILEARDN